MIFCHKIEFRAKKTISKIRQKKLESLYLTLFFFFIFFFFMIKVPVLGLGLFYSRYQRDKGL